MEIGLAIISVRIKLILTESTFRLLNLLDRNNLNIDVMIQSLGKDGTKSVSFTVAKPDMLRTIDVLNDNKDSLGIKKLDYDENVAKISVIGAGVRSHSGVAAKMFGALANAGINTEMITTSEIRITAHPYCFNLSSYLFIYNTSFLLQPISIIFFQSAQW